MRLNFIAIIHSLDSCSHHFIGFKHFTELNFQTTHVLKPEKCHLMHCVLCTTYRGGIFKFSFANFLVSYIYLCPLLFNPSGIASSVLFTLNHRSFQDQGFNSLRFQGQTLLWLSGENQALPKGPLILRVPRVHLIQPD